MEDKPEKKFDLGERTFKFAERTNSFVLQLPSNVTNQEYGKQLVRAVGSVGANYLEAEDALSKKDFVQRIKISRKESKESRYWLRLCLPSNQQMAERQDLFQEATELMKIFGSIIRKSTP